MTTVAPEHVHEHAARPAPTGWRRLLAPGWLRVPWMIALFFGIGAGITVLVRWFEGWHPIWKGSIITTVELTSVPIDGFFAPGDAERLGTVLEAPIDPAAAREAVSA